MPSLSADGLQQLVDCAAGCGFKGDTQKRSLCSKCWRDFQKEALRISADDAVAHALQLAGFCSLDDAKLSLLAKKRRYKTTEVLPVNIPGATEWKTDIRPYTQFDEFPEKGTTACTYIAGLCALWACMGDLPKGKDWARCMTLGIHAYHLARRENPVLKTSLTDLKTALPFIMRMAPFPDIHVPPLQETLLLLADEHQLSAADAEQASCIGLSEDHPRGKAGVCSYFRKAFIAGARAAVVIVHPPETWCAVSSASGHIALRDSHRRTQYEFEHMEAFESWLLKDHAPSNMFFGASVKCGLESNLVEMYTFSSLDMKPQGREQHESTSASADTMQEHNQAPPHAATLPHDHVGLEENSSTFLSSQSNDAIASGLTPEGRPPSPEQTGPSVCSPLPSLPILPAAIPDSLEIAEGERQKEAASMAARQECKPIHDLPTQVLQGRGRSSSPAPPGSVENARSDECNLRMPSPEVYRILRTEAAQQKPEASPRHAETIQDRDLTVKKDEGITNLASMSAKGPCLPKTSADALFDHMLSCIFQAGMMPTDLMAALDGHSGACLYYFDLKELLCPLIPDISADQARELCRKLGDADGFAIEKQAFQLALDEASNDAKLRLDPSEGPASYTCRAGFTHA